MSSKDVWCLGSQVKGFQSSLRSSVWTPCGLIDTYVKRVCNALPKFVGSLRLVSFPPTGNVD